MTLILFPKTLEQNCVPEFPQQFLTYFRTANFCFLEDTGTFAKKEGHVSSKKKKILTSKSGKSIRTEHFDFVRQEI